MTSIFFLVFYDTKTFDYYLAKKGKNIVATWKDLNAEMLFREETLELLSRIVLSISVFPWGLFKVFWGRRKAALVTIGQGKCVIISYITNKLSAVCDKPCRG